MLKVGLQLYTVRDECERNFFEAIRKVSSIGYAGLEFAGYYGVGARELRKFLDDLGIEAVNSHVELENMENGLEAEIEYAKILGMKTITMPWLPEEYRHDENAFLRTSEIIAKIDEECHKSGLQLCYHNHDFEFTIIRGEYALDTFMKDAKHLKLELDTFWSSYSGVDTPGYMKKYAGRLQYIHLKDMLKASEPVFAEVGEGCLDIESFIRTASGSGVGWAFVEQDQCRRQSLESAGISFENIKKLLAK